MNPTKLWRYQFAGVAGNSTILGVFIHKDGSSLKFSLSCTLVGKGLKEFYPNVDFDNYVKMMITDVSADTYFNTAAKFSGGTTDPLGSGDLKLVTGTYSSAPLELF